MLIVCLLINGKIFSQNSGSVNEGVLKEKTQENKSKSNSVEPKSRYVVKKQNQYPQKQNNNSKSNIHQVTRSKKR